MLSPPDTVERLPATTRRCSPRQWAASLAAVHARWPDDDPPYAALRALAEPLAYQWVPLLALRSGRTRRVLLADEVGMGKTVQAGLVLAEMHDRMAMARTLTVVPASLVTQWRHELERRFALTAAILDSDTLAASTSSGGPPAEPGDACLISLDTLRQPEVAALLEGCAWHLLVVDEAHLLVPGSARSEAVARLARRAARVLLCTATPFSGVEHQDRHLLAVGARATHAADDRILVVRRHATTLGRPPATRRVAWVAMGAAEREVHARLDEYVARAVRDPVDATGRLAACLLQRRACSSVPALITSVERRLDVLGLAAGADDLTQLPLPLGDEREAIEHVLRVPAWDDVRAERACLGTILAAARSCTSAGAKARWLIRLVARCRDPLLVFTEYADTLRALRPLLSPSRRVVCLYGAQTADQRQLAVGAFCGGDADLLLATDAAAEGLNLHERCRVVVHVDVPWSPRRLTQRNGRLDRLGQTRRVHATVLAGRGTFDAAVLARLDLRRQRVETMDAAAHGDLAVAASRRRDRAAEAYLSRCIPSASSLHRPPSHDVLHTFVSAMRWRRLAVRLGLPRGTSGLVLAEAGLSALHPLVRGRLWMAAATGGGTLPSPALDWLSARPEMVRFVARARRRSARHDALDAAARHAIPATPVADLFGVHPAGARLDLSANDARTLPDLHILTLRCLSRRP